MTIPPGPTLSPHPSRIHTFTSFQTEVEVWWQRRWYCYSFEKMYFTWLCVARGCVTAAPFPLYMTWKKLNRRKSNIWNLSTDATLLFLFVLSFFLERVKVNVHCMHFVYNFVSVVVSRLELLGTKEITKLSTVMVANNSIWQESGSFLFSSVLVSALAKV